MQEFSSGRYSSFVETNDALITGVRGIARRLSSFVRTPFDMLMEQLAIPLSNQRTVAKWLVIKANGPLNFTGLLGRMIKALFLSPTASLVSRHEVAILYLGRTSEFLRLTSERMVIPTGRYTLGQLLCSLYKRGDRWEDELDDSNLMCTVNGREARLFDTIKPGAQICISSRKSIFEA
jgi:hypothetical protein